jgi:hypothetical protein
LGVLVDGFADFTLGTNSEGVEKFVVADGFHLGVNGRHSKGGG